MYLFTITFEDQYLVFYVGATQLDIPRTYLTEFPLISIQDHIFRSNQRTTKSKATAANLLSKYRTN